MRGDAPHLDAMRFVGRHGLVVDSDKRKMTGFPVRPCSSPSVVQLAAGQVAPAQSRGQPRGQRKGRHGASEQRVDELSPLIHGDQDGEDPQRGLVDVGGA